MGTPERNLGHLAGQALGPQIHQHQVFSPLLGVSLELFLQGLVLAGGLSPGACSGNGPRLGQTTFVTATSQVSLQSGLLTADVADTAIPRTQPFAQTFVWDSTLDAASRTFQGQVQFRLTPVDSFGARGFRTMLILYSRSWQSSNDVRRLFHQLAERSWPPGGE